MIDRKFREPAFCVALATLAAGSVALYFAIEFANVYLTKLEIYPRSGLTLNSLPTDTANWKIVGFDQIESTEMVDELGTENYLTRTYVEKEGKDGKRPRWIQLHVAYYTGMIDTVPHVPDRCFVGAGISEGGNEAKVPIRLDDSSWLQITDVRESWAGQVFSMRASSEYGETGGDRITLPRNPRDIEMRVMDFIDQQGNGLYAGYFFIANGGTVARAEGVRMLAFDLSDDYSYYLKVQCTSSSVESLDELGEIASSLLGDLIGDIMYCLPDWVEVDQGLWPLDNPRRKGEDASVSSETKG